VSACLARIPDYIAEVAPDKGRGRLGLMYQLATVGAVAATIVSYFLSREWLRRSAALDVCLRNCTCGGLFTPAHSFARLPPLLAEKRRFSEASAVLSRIGGEEEGRREMTEIESSMHTELRRFRELLRPGMGAAVGTGVILGVLNNWTGWPGIAFYLPTLFQRAGYTKASDAMVQNVLVMAGIVLLTLEIRLADRPSRQTSALDQLFGSYMCVPCVDRDSVSAQRDPWSRCAGRLFVRNPSCDSAWTSPLAHDVRNLSHQNAREGSESFYHAVVVAAFTGPLAFPMLESLSERIFRSIARVFWLYSMHLFVFFYPGMEIPTGDARAIPGEHSDLLVARIAQRLSIAALKGIGENIASSLPAPVESWVVISVVAFCKPAMTLRDIAEARES
jgi:hypothetical protein